jgi:hypothetical protein
MIGMGYMRMRCNGGKGNAWESLSRYVEKEESYIRLSMGVGVGVVFPEAEEQIIDPGAVFVADAALSLGWSVLSLLSPMLSPFSLLPCPGERESVCV